MKTDEAKNAEALKEHILSQSLKVLKRLPAMGPVIMLYMQSSHRRFHFISDLAGVKAMSKSLKSELPDCTTLVTTLFYNQQCTALQRSEPKDEYIQNPRPNLPNLALA